MILRPQVCAWCVAVPGTMIRGSPAAPSVTGSVPGFFNTIIGFRVVVSLSNSGF